MLCLSPSPILNPISLSPRISPSRTQLFNGTPLSFISPAKRLLITKKHKPNSSISANSVAEQEDDEEEEGEYQVLTSITSEYNNIVILESEKSKVLLLDDSGNVHSILYKGKKWTNSNWDEFTSLPAIIPKGPVAIFGLGGGTVAHQLLEFWPLLTIDGWELDEILIDQARIFFGISELELRNNNGDSDSGSRILRVCIGDALSPSASIDGGYAGIIVDLFSDGDVLLELEVAETWLKMKEKLMPNGRIMVNCGGAEAGYFAPKETGWKVNSTIKALIEAFGGQFVNWKKMPENESGNFMAFTGPLPDLDLWSASVPEKLSSAVKQWRPLTCE